jgi:site-specific DNA recombinase
MTTTGREYLRVSVDKSGRARSTEEQHGDNERAASQLGWSLGAPYVDNGISASRYSAKARDGFAKLLDDLAKGRFGADVLILWESSRGSRKVSEWCSLLELLERCGVVVYVTTHGRTYDPSNVRDRRTLLEDAVDSEYESGKTSVRMKRAHAASAEQGRPAGLAPFGYSRRYDEKTRQLVAQDIVPDEAKIVRELYDRINKGHSLRAIATDLERRGVRTRNGKPFTGTGVRQLVLAPVYGGWRAHQTGTHGNGYRTLDGVTLTEGTWPPIVPRDLWWSVRRRLTDPKRTNTLPGGTRHLLTLQDGVVCHHCDAHLVSTKRYGAEQLQCRKGHVRLDERELTRYVESVLLDKLAQPDMLDELRRGDDDHADDDLARVRERLAEARAELQALRGAVAAGTLAVANLVAVEPGLLGRIEMLEHTERDLSAPPELAALISPGRDVRRRWRRAPISARRDVVKLLLVPNVLGQLRVLRSPTPGQRPLVAQRVLWRRPDGDHHV